MSAFITGIQEDSKRAYYPNDNVFVTTDDNQKIRNFNGAVTSSEIDKNDDRKQRICLDEIIQIDTVSDKLRDTKIKILQKNKNKSIGIILLSVISSSTAGGVIIYKNTNKLYPGLGIIAIGATIAVWGIYRIHQFLDEIKNWESNLDGHIKTRKEIPLEGNRSNRVFNSKLKGKYISEAEAYNLWQHDITEKSSVLNEHQRIDNNEFFPVNEKSGLVVKTLDNGPLRNNCISYFETPALQQKHQELITKINDITMKYNILSKNYNEGYLFLEKNKNNELANINNKYQVGKDVISAGNIIGHTLLTNICSHNCGCRRAIFSSSCSQYCQTRACQEQALKNWKMNVGIDAMSVVATAPLNSKIKNEQHPVIQKFNEDIRVLHSRFQEKVSLLFPELCKLYNEYNISHQQIVSNL